MSRRGCITLGVLLILLLACVCSGGGYVFIRPPERPCEITELLIDETAFPEGTRIGWTESPMAGGPLGRPIIYYSDANRGFWPAGPGGSIHYVFRAKTPKLAERIYEREARGAYAENKNVGPWAQPEEIAYRSPIADTYTLQCGRCHGGRRCTMIAQYAEYVVKFTTPIGLGMDYEGLERVLRAIDERMAVCLGDD